LADTSALDQPHDALNRDVAEYCEGLSQDAVMPAYPSAFGLALRPSLIPPFPPVCPTVDLGQGSA